MLLMAFLKYLGTRWHTARGVSWPDISTGIPHVCVRKARAWWNF